MAGWGTALPDCNSLAAVVFVSFGTVAGWGTALPDDNRGRLSRHGENDRGRVGPDRAGLQCDTMVEHN